MTFEPETSLDLALKITSCELSIISLAPIIIKFCGNLGFIPLYLNWKWRNLIVVSNLNDALADFGGRGYIIYDKLKVN
jgi:hypothetical protein